jgi:hypothetical protein
MQQVWTADGQEPRDLRADYGLPDYELAPARRGGHWLGAAAWRVGGAAMLALMALGIAYHRPADPPQATLAPEVPYSVDSSLQPLISIAFPGQAHYVARSRGARAGRKDTLTLGEWDADALFLRVSVQQSASAPAPLFVDLAMQSAELGAAVLRMSRPETFVGARGPVEWAEANLSGAKGERSCIGFRLSPAGGNRLSGLACGAAEIKLDRAKLECLLDALSLTPAGQDAGLGAVLSGAAPRHTGCARGLV